MIKQLLLTLILLINIVSFGHAQNESNTDWHSKTIICKVKPEYRRMCATNTINDSRLKQYIVYLDGHIVKLFPHHKAPRIECDILGRKLVDISLIYELKYTKNISEEKVVSQLTSSGMFEYVQRRPLSHCLDVVNDSMRHQQYYLDTIKAYEAWEICQGDSNVVIGISDTGVELDHDELKNKIKRNYQDPIDGIDNDNDGYIDNYYGWDLGDNDFNPTADKKGHGIHVSGLAAAETNNQIGIAGVGYKCMFLPVKNYDFRKTLSKDYESIVYAADHGCNIINCSWGGSNYPGQFGIDVINYAIYNKACAVLFAAGNTQDERLYFPAALPNVISVAGTDTGDTYWPNTTRNYFVDVCAPSSYITSTWYNNGYLTSGGTSMGCPITAGAVGLVKSHRPNLTNEQAAHLLRVNCDNIDTISMNYQVANRMGKGRINVYKALIDTVQSSIRMIEQENIMLGSTINNYDTIALRLKFANFLQPTQNLKIKITPAVTSSCIMLNDSLIQGAVATLQTFNNYTNPFKIVILPSTPDNEILYFRIDYSDGNFADFEYVSVLVKRRYIDIQTPLLQSTITATSSLGFADRLTMLGKGLIYDDHENMLYSAGLIVGKSQSIVVDNQVGSGFWKNDFIKVSNPIEFNAISLGNRCYRSEYNDAGATLPMDIRVSQNVYVYDSLDKAGFMIVVYDIINMANYTQQDVYASLFCDFDFGIDISNQARFETSKNLGYTQSTSNGLLAGTSILTPGNSHFYAFDNDGSDNSIELYDGFDNYEKYSAMSMDRLQAGDSLSYGGDVSQLHSYGPFSIASLDTMRVAFVLTAGYNLAELKANIDKAANEYDNYTAINEVLKNQDEVIVYPNPATHQLEVLFKNSLNKKASVELIDLNGRIVKYLSNCTIDKNFSLNINDIDNGLYILKIITEEQEFRTKIIKQ